MPSSTIEKSTSQRLDDPCWRASESSRQAYNTEVFKGFPLSGCKQIKLYGDYLAHTSSLYSCGGLFGSTFDVTIQEIEKIVKHTFAQFEEDLAQTNHQFVAAPLAYTAERQQLQQQWQSCSAVFSSFCFLANTYLERYAQQPDHPGLADLALLQVQLPQQWQNLKKQWYGYLKNFPPEELPDDDEDWVLLYSGEEMAPSYIRLGMKFARPAESRDAEVRLGNSESSENAGGGAQEAVEANFNTNVWPLPQLAKNQGGWLKSVTSSWIASQDLHEIDWKIGLYYSILIQLADKILPLLSELQEPELADAEASDCPLLAMKNCLGQFQKEHQFGQPQKCSDLERLQQLYLGLFLPALRRSCQRYLPASNSLLPFALQPQAQIVQQICYTLFTSISLSSVMRATIEKFTGRGPQLVHRELFMAPLQSATEQKKQEEGAAAFVALTPRAAQIPPEESSLGHEISSLSEEQIEEAQPQPHAMLWRLKQMQSDIEAAPRTLKTTIPKQLFSSLIGTFNVDFDIFLQGNPVHPLYTWKIALPLQQQPTKSIQALAFGCPTHEYLSELPYAFLRYLGYSRQESGCSDNVGINPEFLGFLTSCKEQKLRHFYLSHQSLIPALVGDESIRSNLLIDLANQSTMQETFFLCILSKNSPFYMQSVHYYPETMEQSLFIQQLKAELLSSTATHTGNYICPSIYRCCPQLEERVSQLIDAIASICFSGKEQLTRSERQILIELCYSFFIIELLLALDINSFNITCKDAIDRAAAANAQLFALLALLVGREKEPQIISFFEQILMVRALLVRFRAIDRCRFTRAEQTVSFLLDHPAAILQLFAKLYPSLFFSLELN